MIKKKPVLCSTGKHPIWFGGTLGYKVIDQYADVAFMPADNKRCLIPSFLHRINPGNNALPCCFLIAGGPIDLARKKKDSPPFLTQVMDKAVSEVQSRIQRHKQVSAAQHPPVLVYYVPYQAEPLKAC